MLYIDNPVGVGLSRTNVADGFVHDENQVGRDLYSFISQFFIIFGDRAANPLWIAGESYGGE
jgi:carboxypeptidase D